MRPDESGVCPPLMSVRFMNRVRCLPLFGPLPRQFFEEVWRARARAHELCTTATLEYGPPEWSESGFDS